MKIKSGKDFWAGLMFLGFGLGFMLGSFNYPMGSAVRMGPAYFPAVLGGLLAILGLAIFARAFFSKLANPFKIFAFRPLLLVGAAVIGAGTYFASGMLKSMPMVEMALVAASLFLFFGAFGPRPLFLILLSVVIFGYALKPLGLVLATALLIILSAFGGHDFRNKEIAILTVILVVFGVFVFVKGLGLPFNLWPGE